MLRTIVPLLLIAVVSIFGTCSKTDDVPDPINWNGLVTDTAGTGDNGRVYMPNAFSANADGMNDVCRPLTQNIGSIVFTIYDQANNVVFTTTQLGQGWLITASANTSVKYYYKIQTITTSNHRIGQCGEVYKLTCFPSAIPRSNFYFEDQLTPNGFTGVTSEVLSACP